MFASGRLTSCTGEHTRWSEIEVCTGDRKTNNSFFVTALELLIDLIVSGKFPPYEVDPVVFRVVSRVYEHYEGKGQGVAIARGSFHILVGMGEQGDVQSDRSGNDGRSGVPFGHGAYHQAVSAVQVSHRSNLRALAGRGCSSIQPGHCG